MQTNELHLERMTWPEVRAALDTGRTTVVVACGATEQHGPHLPLLVDAEQGTRLAGEVASRLGDALVAPTIRVGCSDHHLDFAGTISLRRSTLKAVCVDYCTSLAHHGFRRILLIPSHGGNFDLIAESLEELRELVAPGTEVHAFTDLRAWIRCWRDAIAEVEPELAARVGGHADIAETSIMLALHPALVRAGRVDAGYTGPTDGDFFDRITREGLATVTSNGILGDARGASAELGERCIRAVADMLAAHFQALATSGR